jgi:hypothetical protein
MTPCIKSTARTASQAGKRSRDKGRRWEQQVARDISAAVGCDSRRGLQYRDGADAPDVLTPGIPLHLECKAGGPAAYPWRALEQAQASASAGTYPVAVCKQDRRPPTATLAVADLVELLGAGVADAVYSVTLDWSDFLEIVAAWCARQAK